MRVNMNHAATSGKKPKEVIDAVTTFITENSHTSAGRGGDELSTIRTVFESRAALAGFFGASNPANVIFTSGATESLNMAIHGLLHEGDHVLATGLEHNAVARPLQLLQSRGIIDVTYLDCEPNGSFDPQSISRAVRPNTKLLVMTHASNVLGNVLPVRAAFEEAKKHGLLTVLDAAQSAGHMEVQLDEFTDIIAFTGHKGLRGLAGIGGLVLADCIADKMSVWKSGGTGSLSQSLDMPDFPPDKFEPGTPNMLGIISLHAAVTAINSTRLDVIREKEKTLTARFVEGLRELPVIIYGNYDEESWMPVVSINVPGVDAGVLARRLSEDFGIETRSGLHCSPLAHRTIGTFPQGTLRFSFGVDTTIDELEHTLNALTQVTAKRLVQ